MNHGLVKRALGSAAGVLAYVTAFAWFMSHARQIFGNQPPGWPGSVLLLLIFIISACVTGSLVLLRPAQMYLDGQKKEALILFSYTVFALILMAIAVGLVVVSLG